MFLNENNLELELDFDFDIIDSELKLHNDFINALDELDSDNWKLVYD